MTGNYQGEKEKTDWNSDCFYQMELSNIWAKYGHDKNIPETNFSWQSWNKKERSREEEPKQ